MAVHPTPLSNTALGAGLNYPNPSGPSDCVQHSVLRTASVAMRACASVADAKEKRATVVALKDCCALKLWNVDVANGRSQMTRLKRCNTQREVEFFVELIELAQATLQESW